MNTGSTLLARASRPATMRALAGVAVAALALASAGCQQKKQIPQEKWLVVTSPAAPLLGELEDDEPAEEVIRLGELVRVTRELRPFHWDSKMEGRDAERAGMAVEIQYADDGAHKFGFLSDFGAQASVPATDWLCGEIAGQGPFDKARCQGMLRRARTADGELLVYTACSSGSCPVGVFKGDKLTVTAVDNVTNGWFYQGKQRSLLVVATRWVKDDGRRSGGALVPIVVENGAATRKDEIPVDSVDARDPQKMSVRLVHANVTATEITLQGEETVKTADGTTVSTTPVNEKIPLPAID